MIQPAATLNLPRQRRSADVMVGQFSLARTRILREMTQRGWHRLAIAPVHAGAGATFVAVNLALSMAQRSSTRVLLIELNLGRPGVARQLGIAGSPRWSGTSPDGHPGADYVTIDGLPNLSVVAQTTSESGAAELLQDRETVGRIAGLTERTRADIVLMDTAPILDGDAGLAALPLADAILLVADGRSGTAADIDRCNRLLEGMPPVLSVILNKSES